MTLIHTWAKISRSQKLIHARLLYADENKEKHADADEQKHGTNHGDMPKLDRKEPRHDQRHRRENAQEGGDDIISNVEREKVFFSFLHHIPNAVTENKIRTAFEKFVRRVRKATAKIEHELGIQASYYFRVVPESNQPEYIRQIAALGHEIGYHYEDMAICQGNTEEAVGHFKQQLQYFRQFYPVRTICMHGAPTSKWDG